MTQELNDFGFSFEQEPITDDSKIVPLTEQIELLQEQNTAVLEANRQMYRKIVILLHKLRKSPEQPMIRWPDRAAKIDQFIAELDQLNVAKTQETK